MRHGLHWGLVASWVVLGCAEDGGSRPRGAAFDGGTPSTTDGAMSQPGEGCGVADVRGLYLVLQGNSSAPVWTEQEVGDCTEACPDDPSISSEEYFACTDEMCPGYDDYLECLTIRVAACHAVGGPCEGPLVESLCCESEAISDCERAHSDSQAILGCVVAQCRVEQEAYLTCLPTEPALVCLAQARGQCVESSSEGQGAADAGTGDMDGGAGDAGDAGDSAV